MAIPIYVPEEYGPAPTQSQSQESAISSTAFSSVSVPTASPFLHQLVHELYTVYLEYCTGLPTTSEFQHVTVAEGGTDQNNNIVTLAVDNTTDEGQFGNQRTRAPGTGPHSQFQLQNEICTHEEPEPSPMAQFRPDRSSTTEGSAPTVSEIADVKCTPATTEDSFTSIGRRLRQIADSYQLQDRELKSSNSHSFPTTNTKQTEGSEHRHQITMISSLLRHDSERTWTWTWNWTTTIPMLITVSAASVFITVRAVTTRL